MKPMPKRRNNLPRKVSATGYSEPGKDEVWIEPGRLRVAPTVQAVVEADDWAGGVRLEVWMDVQEGGKASCREIRVQAPEGLAITGQLLKDITLPRIMAAAMVDAAWRIDPETSQFQAADSAEMEERYPDSIKRPTQGKRKSDEFLMRIVKLYRHALDEGMAPSRLIEREEMVDRTTVRRWLAEAVKRGLMDESERLSAADGARLSKAH